MTRKINYTSIPTEGLVYQADLDGGVPSGSSATNVPWVDADRGYVEEVASLNGGSSYIDTGYTNFTTQTICMWFKIGGLTSPNSYLCSSYNAVSPSENNSLIISGSTETAGKIQILQQSTNATYNILTSTSTYNDGGWHFVCGEFNYDTNSLVLNLDNGKEVLNGTYSTFSTTGNSIKLGRLGTVSSRYFNGAMGLFKIYNRTLSQDEINNLYQEGLRKFGPTENKSVVVRGEADLITDLELAYNGDDIVTDTSGNGNDGTNNNVTEAIVGTQVVGEYNGGSSYINTGITEVFSTFTLSCSFNTSSTSDGDIFGKYVGITGGRSFIVRKNSDGTIQFYISSNGSSITSNFKTTNSFNDGENHLLNVINYGSGGSLPEIYIDGVKQSGTQSGSAENVYGSSQAMAIGAISGSDPGTYFDGTIGLPYIYSKALTQGEINALYLDGMERLGLTTLPTAELSYDSNEGLATDTSGNENDGTVTNVTETYVGGQLIGEYNGSSSYITATRTQNTEISVNFWLKGTNTPSSSIYTKAFSYTPGATGGALDFSYDHVQGDFRQTFSMFNGTSFFTAGLNETLVGGDWNMLTCTFDGTTLKSYLNGVFQNQATHTGTIQNRTLLNIGRAFSGAQYINGQIGLFRDYNTTLSQEEITALYIDGKERLGEMRTDSLVASYDSNTDITLDTSGNGNDGTATSVTERVVGRQLVGEYNGSSSYVETSGISGTLFDQDFSINFVFKYENYGNEDYFFAGVNRDLAIKFNPNGLAFTMYNGTEHLCEHNISNFTIGDWYNITAVRDKINGTSLYVNSINVDNNTFIGNANSSTGNPLIGVRYAGSNVQAKIGLFKIYDKALSQAEITSLYQEGLQKLSFPKYSLPNLEEGKVLEISKPQSGGTYYDQTGNGYNGTNSGVIDSADGLYNVMSFEGGNQDRVELGVVPISTYTNLTYSCIFKAETLPGVAFLMANSLSVRLLTVGDKLRADNRDTGGTYKFTESNTTLVTGKKYHGAVTFTGNGTMKVYLDGVFETEVAVTNKENADSYGFRLGIDKRTAYDSPFTGDIINAKMWSRALSAEEIRQDFYSSKLI